MKTVNTLFLKQILKNSMHDKKNNMRLYKYNLKTKRKNRQ